MKTILEVKGITKYFGRHPALKDVSFSLKSGEILGLVGANGSGKSTLMNILYGNPVIAETGSYAGSVLMSGNAVSIGNTKDAIELGIGMVHQEFALFPMMSVTENIKICKENIHESYGRVFTKEYALINKGQNHDDASAVISQLGIGLDGALLIRDLSTNMKQFVEIAREIDRKDLKLLILDEPTAVLNHKDSEILMSILRQLSGKGIGIIFISHRLDEIKSVCSKVMVLRDGEVVSTYEGDAIEHDQLAEDMIGGEIVKTVKMNRVIKEKTIIAMKDYSVDYPGDEVKGLDLEIYEGEILGITSLSGHGKLGVAKGLMGMYPVSGTISLGGTDVEKEPYIDLIKKGVYVLCEDRKEIGLLMGHSIKENIIFTANQALNRFSHKSILGALSFLNHHQANKHVAACIERLDINCRSKGQRVSELSGGNQQKVCFARALSIQPKVLFVSEPTRGIDIAAKERILASVRDVNEKEGTTVIVASSELEELIRICDRIVVMCEGKLSKILPTTATPLEFGNALSGSALDNSGIEKIELDGSEVDDHEE